MRDLIIVLSVAIMVLGCKKPENRSCAKFTGKNISKEVKLNEFNRLFLGPHLKYILVQDTEEKVVISGGENLVNFIKTEIKDGLLSIRNENKCNFLRSYKKEVTVELHLKKIHNIQFEGTKELICSNTLNLDDVVLVIRDGAGKVNLDLNANSLQTVVTNGWGNFDFKGIVNYLKLEIKANGFGTTYDLDVVDSVHVLTKTQETVSVRFSNGLNRVEVNGGGDVWYKGSPSNLFFNQYGTGQLLDKN